MKLEESLINKIIESENEIIEESEDKKEVKRTKNIIKANNKFHILLCVPSFDSLFEKKLPNVYFNQAIIFYTTFYISYLFYHNKIKIAL